MYLNHWKLARRPFDERIDPQWFFPSGVHQGTALQLRAIVERRQPIALLVGSVGSGKSMVAAHVADHFGETRPSITLHINPATAAHVLHGILDELVHTKTAGINSSAEWPNPKELVDLVKKQLARRHEAGQHIVTFLEAAHDMPEAELGGLLHTLRNLTETPAMTTLIIGSPELLLRTRRLPRQSDRLFPQCVLGAMAPADTALYVRHRMLRAGGDPEIFPAAAVEIIHDLCGGIARRINRLCDLCLLVGYSKNCDAVTPGLIWMAQGEIRFLAPSRTALAAPTRRWRAFRRHSEPKMVIGDRLSGDR